MREGGREVGYETTIFLALRLDEVCSAALDSWNRFPEVDS